MVDASVAVLWVLPEEHSGAASRLLALEEELHAPDLLWPEAGNVIWKKQRRREITPPEGRALLADLRRFPVTIHGSEMLTDSAWELATELDRSFYDSLYLALALHTGCPLVTGDGKLVRALRGAASPLPLIWVGELA